MLVLCLTLLPDGRLGDLCEANEIAVRYYLGKHINCASHQSNALRRSGHVPGSEAPDVDCVGIEVGQPGCGRLSGMAHEFSLWAMYSNLKD